MHLIILYLHNFSLKSKLEYLPKSGHIYHGVSLLFHNSNPSMILSLKSYIIGLSSYSDLTIFFIGWALVEDGFVFCFPSLLFVVFWRLLYTSCMLWVIH